MIGFGLILAIIVIGVVGNGIRSLTHHEQPSSEAVRSTDSNNSPPPSSETKAPSRIHVQIMAERNLKEALKDPDSAKLRNVKVPTGAAYVCGEVNSRNAFGGMTGYKRFIAGAASTMPAAVEGENIDGSEFASAWATLCA